MFSLLLKDLISDFYLSRYSNKFTYEKERLDQSLVQNYITRAALEQTIYMYYHLLVSFAFQNNFNHFELSQVVAKEKKISKGNHPSLWKRNVIFSLVDLKEFKPAQT